MKIFLLLSVFCQRRRPVIEPSGGHLYERDGVTTVFLNVTANND